MIVENLCKNKKSIIAQTMSQNNENSHQPKKIDTWQHSSINNNFNIGF